MKYLIAAATLGLATPAMADVQRMMAEGSVDDAYGRLVSAVESSPATIFAQVNHGQGAADAGMDLGESRLLIFGNPELGTPIMQEDIEAGLYLPLEMLVYAEGGQTYVAYREMDDYFDDLDVDDDSGAVRRIDEALDNFARAAAGGS